MFISLLRALTSFSDWTILHRWLSILIGPILVVLVLLWSARDFLPFAHTQVFDTRHLVWSVDDKADEWMGALGSTLPRCLDELVHGPPQNPGLHLHGNVLPMLAIRGLALGLPPILATNLAILLAALANALSGALLARALGADWPSSYLGGLTFALAPFTVRVLAWASLDYGFMAAYGLVLWAALACFQRRGAGPPLVLGLALAIQGYTGPYGVLALVPFLAALLLWGSPGEGLTRWGGVARCGAGTGLGLLLLGPLLRLELPMARWFMEQGRADRGVLPNDAPPDLEWIRSTWGLDGWLVLVIPLVLAALLPLAGARERGPGPGIRRGLAALSLLWAALLVEYRLGRPLTDPLFQGIALLWRARRLEMTLAVPLVVLSALAAVGLGHLRTRLSRWPGASPAVLLGATLVTLLVLDPVRSRASLAARFDTLGWSPTLQERLEALPAGTQVALLDGRPRTEALTLLRAHLRSTDLKPVVPESSPWLDSLREGLLLGSAPSPPVPADVALLIRVPSPESRTRTHHRDHPALDPRPLLDQGLTVSPLGGWALVTQPSP